MLAVLIRHACLLPSGTVMIPGFPPFDAPRDGSCGVSPPRGWVNEDHLRFLTTSSATVSAPWFTGRGRLRGFSPRPWISPIAAASSRRRISPCDAGRESPCGSPHATPSLGPVVSSLRPLSGPLQELYDPSIHRTFQRGRVLVADVLDLTHLTRPVARF